MLELVRLPRDPQAAHVRRSAERADLLGDLVDALLGCERGAIDADRDLVPELLDGVLMGGRGAGDEEAAVAAARPPAAVGASTTVQSTPRSARCQAHESPAMPAPITSTSVSWRTSAARSS